jgi:hypothetical protein
MNIETVRRDDNLPSQPNATPLQSRGIPYPALRNAQSAPQKLQLQFFVPKYVIRYKSNCEDLFKAERKVTTQVTLQVLRYLYEVRVLHKQLRSSSREAKVLTSEKNCKLKNRLPKSELYYKPTGTVIMVIPKSEFLGTS